MKRGIIKKPPPIMPRQMGHPSFGGGWGRPCMLYYINMIGYITGSCIDIREQSIIILAHGVGYEIYVPQHTIGSAVAHTELSLWVTTMRENSLELFGFPSKDEYRLFKKLIAVSGVGPRSALNILDVASVEMLVTAITSNDASLLTKVSGIGKKTAEKIVLELSDKLDDFITNVHAGITGATKNRPSHSDVIDALLSLGYSQQQARGALANIPKDISTTQEQVREALRFLG